MPPTPHHLALITPALTAVFAAAALAQPAPPSYDFDFATIGSTGNAPWIGKDPYGYAYGRGQVDYTYRISKLETTTAQWMEFVNTYSVLGGQWTHFADPIGWGGEPDPTYTGPGRRYRLSGLPDAARLPVDGISWREAAMFCNWLHNEKSSAIAALQSGAYDTSTFGTNPNHTFTDQLTHSPGAKYWIPTLDERLKAVYYDPNRHGPSVGGYWDFANMSDQPPVPGLPGQGTTSGGLLLPNSAEWEIPLGAYRDQVSPWGLWDTSGGTKEWLEEVLFSEFPVERGLGGSFAGGPGFQVVDRIYGLNSLSPDLGATGAGLRIASAVPVPGSITLLSAAGIMFARRRRS